MGFSKAEQVRVFKVKPIKTKTADEKFSLWIRTRDKHCQYPGCGRGEPLDCSHFFERGHSGTRFDPDNCIALCRTHHTEWERRKKYDYEQFMIQRIGLERFDAMKRRAWTFKNRTEAVLEFMARGRINI